MKRYAADTLRELRRGGDCSTAWMQRHLGAGLADALEAARLSAQKRLSALWIERGHDSVHSFPLY
jgi:hypothetical protein